jgi:small-conductance mechanosensitive channel
MSMDDSAVDASFYKQSESRISRLTLLLGAVSALAVLYSSGWRWAAGIFIGSVLAWLNFRWLQQGLDALTASLAAQGRRRNAKIPIVTYFKVLFRYGLIALTVYVIFRYLNVPVLSMVFGLCALGAATLVVSVHSIFGPSR